MKNEVVRAFEPGERLLLRPNAHGERVVVAVEGSHAYRPIRAGLALAVDDERGSVRVARVIARLVLDDERAIARWASVTDGETVWMTGRMIDAVVSEPTLVRILEQTVAGARRRQAQAGEAQERASAEVSARRADVALIRGLAPVSGRAMVDDGGYVMLSVPQVAALMREATGS